MSRRVGKLKHLTLGLVGLCALAAIVVAVAARWMKADRAVVVAQVGNEHLEQLDQAAQVVAQDLSSVHDDLAFAGRVMAAPDFDDAGPGVLASMLAAVKPYCLVRMHDAAGAIVFTARDPRFAVAADEPLFEAAARAGSTAALRPDSTGIRATQQITTPRGVFRVFSSRTETRSGPGAITLLVDSGALFAKLALLASPSSRLLVVGPHGRPESISDPRLAAAFDAGAADDEAFGAVLAALRGFTRGTKRIEQDDAVRAGFDPVPLIVAYTSVVEPNGDRWELASFNSVASLEARERAVALRVGFAAGIVMLLLLGFGLYLFRASQREAALRDRIAHSEELARVHDRTERILDNIPVGVLVVGADAQVTAANQAIRARAEGSPPVGSLALFFPDAPHAVVDRLTSLLEAASSERRVKSIQGERLALFGVEGHFTLHAVPLAPHDPLATTVLVVEDSTEVSSLASQLLRAEKLATVGVLAAGIAHEIGTPLGVARGRAEYVLGKLGEEHAQARSLNVIVDQMDGVTRTIRQLLDFARVRPSAAFPVAVDQLVGAVAELLRFEAERRRVHLRVDADADLPTVAANPDELQQALVNLVMNALDACEIGGTVRIRAALEVAGWRRVRIVVEDDGCGVEEAHRAQVFDPFFTTKKRGQGTGLGLSVVAQIVRNHGGEIELESEVGRGTRVVLLWPAAAEERANAAAS